MSELILEILTLIYKTENRLVMKTDLVFRQSGVLLFFRLSSLSMITVVIPEARIARMELMIPKESLSIKAGTKPNTEVVKIATHIGV